MAEQKKKRKVFGKVVLVILILILAGNAFSYLHHILSPYFREEVHYGKTEPAVSEGKTQAFVNRKGIINEELWVETPVDSDHDGKRDLIYVKIRRPGETEDGLKAASLIRVSPYNSTDFSALDTYISPDKDYEGSNNPDTTALNYQDIETSPHTYSELLQSGFQPDWLPAERKSSGSGKAKQIPAWLNKNNWRQYFVMRGYAAIDVCSLGDHNSEGLVTVGTNEEALAAASVVDWLNGRVKAYTCPTEGGGYTEVKADWSNGKAAMEGTSYEGALPVMAAGTGVKGLETIIPECAPYNWYDYYRDGGIVHAPDKCQGEDLFALHMFCESRQNGFFSKTKPDSKVSANIRAFETELQKDENRTTGDYNSCWDDRNTAKNASNMKCSVLLCYGLNDRNVKLKNAALLARACRDHDVTYKVILHPGAHEAIQGFDGIDIFGKLQGWLDHYLYGIDNGMPESMPNAAVFNNLTCQWDTFQDWPAGENKFTEYVLSAGSSDGKTGNLQAGGNSSANAEAQFTDSYLASVPEKDRKKEFGSTSLLNMLLNRNDTGKGMTAWDQTVICGKPDSGTPDLNAAVSDRLLYLSDELTEDMHLSGTGKITVSAKSDQNTGAISAMLVDYGENYDSVSEKGSRVELGNGGYATLSRQVRDKEAYAYKVVAQGSVDVQNPNESGKTWMDCADTNYIPDYLYRTKQITPGEYNTYTWTFNAADYHFAKGHRFGLILYGSDPHYTTRPLHPGVITVDIGKAVLSLPFTAF